MTVETTITPKYLRSKTKDEIIDHVMRLLAENAQLRKDLEWEPIETAPKPTDPDTKILAIGKIKGEENWCVGTIFWHGHTWASALTETGCRRPLWNPMFWKRVLPPPTVVKQPRRDV